MQTAKEILMQAELSKISRLNPSAIPLYIAINSLANNQSVEQPITLCSKTMIVSDFLKQMRKKFPKYQHVYFFGKDKEEKDAERTIAKSSKQTKKKTSQTTPDPQRILLIDQQMMSKSLQQMHQRYKDNNGLLIVIVSQLALLKPKTRPLSELLLYLLAVVFAAAFLYVTFSEQPTPKNESQLDYIV